MDGIYKCLKWIMTIFSQKCEAMKDIRELCLCAASPPSCLLLSVPVIWMGTHGCVQQRQVPETYPDHPNPSSHIQSHSNNSWCAGSFAALSFIRGGIRVSLFVLVKRVRTVGRAYTVQRRDLRHVPCASLYHQTLEFLRLVSYFFIFLVWLINHLLCTLQYYVL